MPPEETTDVTPAETTAPESSTENETTTDAAVEPTAAPEDSQGDEVPEQNRWAERARKAEQRLAALEAAREADSTPATQPDPNQDVIKQQLRAMGFVSKEEIDAELARRDQDTRI